MTRQVLEGAIAGGIMLTLFTLLMTVGYWERHERAIWDDICWSTCHVG